MTITALNEILVNLANSDFRVNQAYTGDVYDINTKENRFGCFVATPMTATRTDGGVITYHYVMYFIDRLTDDEANMDLIQTDAVNVLKRVIDNLGYNGIEMGDGYQFTLFKHQFDDWCAGAFVDIDFIVPDMDCGGFHIIPEDVDLRPITITENGKYVPDGFDGFSSIMVNVEGGSDVTKEWVEEEIDNRTQDLATKEELAGKADKSEIPSLEGYATEKFVTSQGYLTEHQHLKTINNISLIGNGNIDIGGGVTEEWVIQAIDDKTMGMVTEDDLDTKLVDYATQTWIEEQGYLKTIPSDYAKKTDIPDVSNFATKDEMGDKVDEAAFDDYKSEVNTALNNKADKSEIPSLDGYATEEFVTSQGYLTEVPSDYAKKTDIPTIPENVSAFNNDAGYLTEHQDISGLATKAEVEAVEAKIPSLTGYATEEFVNETDGARKQWVIDQGYLTEHQSLAGYATESWVEGKGYLTEISNDYIKRSEIDDSWNIECTTSNGTIKAKLDFTPSSTNDNKNFASLGTVRNFYNDTIHKADIWTGTQAQWDALTDAQKASYTIALIRA